MLRPAFRTLFGFIASALLFHTMLLNAGAAHAEGAAPVVAVSPSGKACLMGGAQGGRVLDVDAMRPQLRGGEAYRVLDLYNGPLAATGSRAVEEDICSDVVTLTPAPGGEISWVAIGGSWPPVPRRVMSQEPDQPVYEKAVLDWLKDSGIPAVETKLSQVLRADVDGDGTDEVLLTAEYYAPGESVLGVSAGDHSVVLMRRIAKGKVETVRVSATLAPATDPEGLRQHYRITALADVDGDGTLEAVVYSQYYEGDGTEVYHLAGGTPELAFGCGCGL